MRAHRSTHMRSQEWEPHFVRVGAGEIHMDMSEERFCIEIYRKSAGPQFRGARFVWKFIGKKAHGHFRRAILCGNLQEKCRSPFPGPAICMEIYKEKCTRTLHKSNFVWKFKGKMPDPPAPTLIEHRVLTLTVRPPPVWPHCLGKNRVCVY